jgi:hypothetical protein
VIVPELESAIAAAQPPVPPVEPLEELPVLRFERDDDPFDLDLDA